jgi:outer membrane biosynthesis protein TonB
VTDARTEEKASGCVWWPGLLLWIGVAATGSLLGWSAKTRVLMLVPLLPVALLVAAARQQARDRSAGSRQVPPGRPAPLSMGAGVEPIDSRPEPEPTKPEPEPPPEPTKPPEPAPPKPEAISEETLGKVERFGYRLGRGIAVVLMVAVVAVPVVWWLIARS